MFMDNFFGKDLRSIRNSKHMTQADLALATHLDRSYISMLERGIRHPSLETVLRVCHALEVSPGALVEAIDKRTRYNKVAV